MASVVALANSSGAVGQSPPPAAVDKARIVSVSGGPPQSAVCGKCICQVCTCGKHKCTLRVKNDIKLEGNTEYTTQYHPHQLGVAPRRLQLQPAHVPPDIPLSKDTEHRVQFKTHELPPKLPKRQHDVSALWNQAHFEGASASKEDYKAWPVQPHKKAVQITSPDKLVTSPEKLEAETTNKHDYKSWPVPPPYEKKRAEYVPSKAKLDGTSTHKEAFRQWAVSRPAPPPVQVYRQAQEDRDFRSENRSAFILHPTTVRKPTVVEYHPVITKFEGISTNKSDFKSWPIARRVQYKEKYIPQPSVPLDAHSTVYRDAYSAKSVPRYFHPKVKYVQPDTHFEGQSTQRADFGPKELSRRVDFAPHVVYRPEPDNRDFVTQTHLSHNKKPIMLCEVIKARQMPNKTVTVGKDGHQYWTDEQQIVSSDASAIERAKVCTEPCH